MKISCRSLLTMLSPSSPSAVVSAEVYAAGGGKYNIFANIYIIR